MRRRLRELGAIPNLGQPVEPATMLRIQVADDNPEAAHLASTRGGMPKGRIRKNLCMRHQRYPTRMLDYGASGHYEEAMMGKRKPSVCFVDDDPAELNRFRSNLGSRFTIGVGRTLDDALAGLRKAGPKKPDLFVLDLYFPQGPPNTPQELSELHEAWNKHNDAQAHLLSVLGKLRQTTDGGKALAEEVLQRCRSRNYVFFTRKATLEEGMAALKRGALSVIKKPDPNPAEVKAGMLTEALDSAFRNRSSEIAAELSDAIRKATWWWKHRESVYSASIGLLIGYLASVLANVTPALLRAWR